MQPRADSGSEGQVGVMGEPGFIKEATVRARGGGERHRQGCCQVLTSSEAFRIIQETVAPGSPGGVLGVRAESLRCARKGGFQLEEAAGGVGGWEQDFLPSPEVGQAVREGQSGSCRMEEMRASPGEWAGVTGTLQIPFFSFSGFFPGLGGKKEVSLSRSETHTHTHMHAHTHSRPLPAELPISDAGHSRGYLLLLLERLFFFSLFFISFPT